MTFSYRSDHLVADWKLIGYSQTRETVKRDEAVPFDLKDRLRGLGAEYTNSLILSASRVVEDGRLITGQDPESSRGMGRRSSGDWMPVASKFPARTCGAELTCKHSPIPTLAINREERRLEIEPWTTLLDLLRDKLDLTGTKKGCDHGQCGACTVLINGTRINSCLKLAVTLDGCVITTIEGLGQPGNLHPLQASFIEHDAFQCGYCTPGQICSAQGLINEAHAHSRLEVREEMSGNICRCGAYTNIADAILEVIGREKVA